MRKKKKKKKKKEEEEEEEEEKEGGEEMREDKQKRVPAVRNIPFITSHKSVLIPGTGTNR